MNPSLGGAVDESADVADVLLLELVDLLVLLVELLQLEGAGTLAAGVVVLLTHGWSGAAMVKALILGICHEHATLPSPP